MPLTDRTLLPLAIATMCTIWGTTWLAIRVGLADLPPMTALAARLLVAATVMTLVAPRLSGPDGQRPPTWLAVLMGTVSLGGGFALIYLAAGWLPSGVIAVLWATNPMMLAFAARYGLGERLCPRRAFGFVAGLCGIALLMITDVPKMGAGAVLMAGLVLLSSASGAAMTVLIKRVGGAISPALLTRDGLWVGASIVCGIAWAFERDLTPKWSAPAIASTLYLALFGTCLGFVLWFWALKRASASRLGLVSYVTPVLAVILGRLVGGEAITPSLAMGTALVAGGVALAAWSG